MGGVYWFYGLMLMLLLGLVVSIMLIFGDVGDLVFVFIELIFGYMWCGDVFVFC